MKYKRVEIVGGYLDGNVYDIPMEEEFIHIAEPKPFDIVWEANNPVDPMLDTRSYIEHKIPIRILKTKHVAYWSERIN